MGVIPLIFALTLFSKKLLFVHSAALSGPNSPACAPGGNPLDPPCTYNAKGLLFTKYLDKRCSINDAKGCSYTHPQVDDKCFNGTPESSTDSSTEDSGGLKTCKNGNIKDCGTEGTIPIVFFGKKYTEYYPCANGIISFAGAVEIYTPEKFPASDRPIIAPFWGDVDLRTKPTDEEYGRKCDEVGVDPAKLRGCSYYNWLTGEDANLMNDYIFQNGRPPLGNDKACIVQTWHNVAFYNKKDTDKIDELLNTFQTVVCTDGDLTYAGFFYEKLEWTSGDASDGKKGRVQPASTGCGTQCGVASQVGFDNGEGLPNTYTEKEGSRTEKILSFANSPSWVLYPVYAEIICPEGQENQVGNSRKCVDSPCIQTTDNYPMGVSSTSNRLSANTYARRKRFPGVKDTFGEYAGVCPEPICQQFPGGTCPSEGNTKYYSCAPGTEAKLTPTGSETFTDSNYQASKLLNGAFVGTPVCIPPKASCGLSCAKQHQQARLKESIDYIGTCTRGSFSEEGLSFSCEDVGIVFAAVPVPSANSNEVAVAQDGSIVAKYEIKLKSPPVENNIVKVTVSVHDLNNDGTMGALSTSAGVCKVEKSTSSGVQCDLEIQVDGKAEQNVVNKYQVATFNRAIFDTPQAFYITGVGTTLEDPKSWVLDFTIDVDPSQSNYYKNSKDTSKCVAGTNSGCKYSDEELKAVDKHYAIKTCKDTTGPQQCAGVDEPEVISSSGDLCNCIKRYSGTLLKGASYELKCNSKSDFTFFDFVEGQGVKKDLTVQINPDPVADTTVTCVSTKSEEAQFVLPSGTTSPTISYTFVGALTCDALEDQNTCEANDKCMWVQKADYAVQCGGITECTCVRKRTDGLTERNKIFKMKAMEDLTVDGDIDFDIECEITSSCASKTAIDFNNRADNKAAQNYLPVACFSAQKKNCKARTQDADYLGVMVDFTSSTAYTACPDLDWSSPKGTSQKATCSSKGIQPDSLFCLANFCQSLCQTGHFLPPRNGCGTLMTNEDETLEAQFQLKLLSAPAQGTEVVVSASETSSGFMQPIIFTSQNWNTFQKAIIKGKDDSKSERDTAYTLEVQIDMEKTTDKSQIRKCIYASAGPSSSLSDAQCVSVDSGYEFCSQDGKGCFIQVGAGDFERVGGVAEGKPVEKDGRFVLDESSVSGPQAKNIYTETKVVVHLTNIDNEFYLSQEQQGGLVGGIVALVVLIALIIIIVFVVIWWREKKIKEERRQDVERKRDIAQKADEIDIEFQVEEDDLFNVDDLTQKLLNVNAKLNAEVERLRDENVMLSKEAGESPLTITQSQNPNDLVDQIKRLKAANDRLRESGTNDVGKRRNKKTKATGFGQKNV